MRLVDLQPRWLSKDLFIFKSPSGHGDWISCKRAAMSFGDQCAIIYKLNPDLVGQTVVTTTSGMVWEISDDDFETMTVSPSIDHSPSGNWHGFVRNGEIE